MIAKDNIDFNSSSNTATIDYHGTGFSLMQVGAAEFQDSYQISYAMDTNFRSLKIESLPEEYTQIGTFQSEQFIYFAPKCLDSLSIPSLDSLVLKQAIGDALGLEQGFR